MLALLTLLSQESKGGPPPGLDPIVMLLAMAVPFILRAAICVAAVLLSGLVVTRAGYQFAHGEAGGFRLGVDLVGGTILVYEVDEAKLKEQEEANRGAKRFD